MKKRFTAILLSLCMALTLMPVAAFAQSGQHSLNYLSHSHSNRYYYTGEPIGFDIEFYDDDYTLVENVDYVISYTNGEQIPIEGKPTEIGAYYAVVTGIGNYKDVEEFFFEISDSYNLSYNSCYIDIRYKFLHTGEPIEPDIIVTVEEGLGAGQLTEGEDYTVSYQDEDGNDLSGAPTDVGEYRIKITGIGSYYGENYKYFEIFSPNDITHARINIDYEYIYTGNPVQITGIQVISADGRPMTEDVDYTLTYRPDNVQEETSTPPTEPGRYLLVLTGIGDYTGKLSCAFYIYAQNDLNMAELTGNSAYRFTGEPVDPEITVRLGGEILDKDTDYTVSYIDEYYDELDGPPTAPGLYALRVVGTGDYIGEADIFSFVVCSDEEVTVSIPLEITIEQGGAAKPGKHAFETELYWWPQEGDAEDLLEYITVEGNSFILDGAGTHEKEVKFTGSSEILRFILDYNDIRLAEPREDGWLYSDSEYEIELYENTDGQLQLEIWSYEIDEYVEKCVFTATYTAAETYDLYIAGTRVTGDNADDVLGDGTVSYDPDTKTLTLNNANIEAEDTPYGIYSKEDLTVLLEGENTVSVSGAFSDSDLTAAVYCEKGNLAVKDGPGDGT